MFEFHISRTVRDRYGFADTLFSLNGNVVFANLAACREFAHRVNSVRDVERNPRHAVHPGALHAMGLIDEVLHTVAAEYRRQRDPRAMLDALTWFAARLDGKALDRTLLSFAELFPTVAVYRGQQTASEWLSGSTAGVPHRAVALEELIMLWLANANPAFRPFRELFDDQPLSSISVYPRLTAALHDYFETRPRFGEKNQNLIDLLRAPALAAPDSLEGQLAFIREKWTTLVGDLMTRLLTALDILKEEEVAIWMRFHPPANPFVGGQAGGDSSVAAIPQFGHSEHEYESFTPDKDWMPRAVVMAKSVYVWLDQLSKTYKRPIQRLDQIPDEELDLLARRGFNGLWLIGLWERSRASQRIKQMCGNPEAAASAYSLYDYKIAEDLGGEASCSSLRDRAWARGIRLASDMVPNHMGIDSRWVIEHPDWFISLPHSPFPAYSFHGPDVANDERVEIKIEDHYFDRSDAAVVFRRRDRWTGDTRYVYHGNDGTSFPWNDTAQLNYLRSDVREAVIQTILHVARNFPIIRFDAAMTLAKRHYQRLWFPEPGSGGAIPSRAEHGMTKPQFDAAMPLEFWREVVDRVAAEAPNTLLLAEAFWLMEGYFVRTLGMHRVYNSAFMNMLRDEENANYRSVIKNTLAFDPEVLKRYVNFMNNPDERTAVDQFGKGDKYFGVCAMMATLPGLPMFGHGQIEGYTERYGMEYRRAYHDEAPDAWLVARHDREISPLLHRRYLFAEVRDFLLYDFFTDQGHVNEDVFAYSNRKGEERALVVFNNRYASTHGWVRMSCAYAEKTSGGKQLRQRTLGESFGLASEPAAYAAYRDAFSGLEYLHRARDLAERGLNLELRAYQTNVFLDWRDLRDDPAHPWGELCDQLAGRGVPSLEDALKDLQLKPIHEALHDVVDPALAEALADCATMKEGPERSSRELAVLETIRHRGAALLEETVRYAANDAGQSAGISTGRDRHRNASLAQDLLLDRLGAALRLPALYKKAGARWPADARTVLPLGDGGQPEPLAAWRALLAWCALEAAARLHSPDDTSATATQLFDALRLRAPLAKAFAEPGVPEEEHWRTAARLRASLAHPSPGETPLRWIHDPDVAWLIGVHQHEGVSYLVKEYFERWLWWMALPMLLDLASARKPDLDRFDLMRKAISERMQAVAKRGYRVEALEDLPPLEEIGERQERLQKQTLES
ncbi:MAG TPA: alpha-amylase family glycosyl hydrolase [Candidatus Angelobacter sp.]